MHNDATIYAIVAAINEKLDRLIAAQRIAETLADMNAKLDRLIAGESEKLRQDIDAVAAIAKADVERLQEIVKSVS